MSKRVGLDCKVFYNATDLTAAVTLSGSAAASFNEQTDVVNVEHEDTLQEVDMSDRSSETDQFRYVGNNLTKRVHIIQDTASTFYKALRTAKNTRSPIAVLFSSGPSTNAEFVECGNWAVASETHGEARKEGVVSIFTLKPHSWMTINNP